MPVELVLIIAAVLCIRFINIGYHEQPAICAVSNLMCHDIRGENMVGVPIFGII